MSPCVHNALNALYKRHLSPPPNPAVLPLDISLLHYVSTRVFDFHYQCVANPDGWKVGKTRAKLEQIERSKLYDALASQSAKSFIKRETNPIVPSKARLIQGHKNEATAYFAPHVYRAISAVLKKVEFVEQGVRFQLHYVSGMDHTSIGELYTQFIRHSNVFVIDERDGKNWDSTMQEPHLRYEAAVYALFDNVVATMHLQRSSGTTGKIRCVDAIVRYLTAWKRLSGDWNTSTGNSIISMVIVITVILALPEHLRPSVVMGMFLGDDYLGVYHYAALPDIRELTKSLNTLEAQCGITPVRGLTTDPLLPEFISLTIWPTETGDFAFVPKMSNVLYKLFATVKQRAPSHRLKQELGAVITDFLRVFTGNEFITRFLHAHVRYACLSDTKRSNDFKYSLEHLTHASRILWTQGFIHKYRFPITHLQFPIPQCDRDHVMFLTHPAVSYLFSLEHMDPDERFVSP